MTKKKRRIVAATLAATLTICSLGAVAVIREQGGSIAKRRRWTREASRSVVDLKTDLLKYYHKFGNGTNADATYEKTKKCDFDSVNMKGIVECNPANHGDNFWESCSSCISDAKNNDVFHCDEKTKTCVPKKKSYFKCNPFSGYETVVSTSQGKKIWICMPKFPHLVTNTHYYGDVDKVVACGRHGTLIDPKSSLPWTTESSVSPEDCTCKCDPGFVTLTAKNDRCVPDPCGTNGGTFDFEKKVCQCPRGYVRCDQNSPVFSLQELSLLCPKAIDNGYSICVKDPCGYAGNEFVFDFSKNKCVNLDTDKGNENKDIIFYDKDFVTYPPRGVPYSDLQVVGNAARWIS